MLPYLSPDDNFHLNIGVIAIVIDILSTSSKGKLMLNNDRLHIYTYLVKNPVKMNLVLNALGKGSVFVKPQDSYSITSISANVDPLFDRQCLKALLTSLVASKLVEVAYRKNDGFFYKLSDLGALKVKQLDGEYFSEIRSLCDKLKLTLSLNASYLNQALNQVMRKDITVDGK